MCYFNNEMFECNVWYPRLHFITSQFDRQIPHNPLDRCHGCNPTCVHSFEEKWEEIFDSIRLNRESSINQIFYTLDDDTIFSNCEFLYDWFKSDSFILLSHHRQHTMISVPNPVTFLHLKVFKWAHLISISYWNQKSTRFA